MFRAVNLTQILTWKPYLSFSRKTHLWQLTVVCRLKVLFIKTCWSWVLQCCSVHRPVLSWDRQKTFFPVVWIRKKAFLWLFPVLDWASQKNLSVFCLKDLLSRWAVHHQSVGGHWPVTANVGLFVVAASDCAYWSAHSSLQPLTFNKNQTGTLENFAELEYTFSDL